VGASTAFEEAALTNWMKKKMGYEMSDTGGTTGSQQEEMTGDQEAIGSWREGTNDAWRSNGSRRKRGGRWRLHSPHPPMINIITERTNNSRLTQGWIGDKYL
jgi:hypothetical protein